VAIIGDEKEKLPADVLRPFKSTPGRAGKDAEPGTRGGCGRPLSRRSGGSPKEGGKPR